MDGPADDDTLSEELSGLEDFNEARLPNGGDSQEGEEPPQQLLADLANTARVESDAVQSDKMIGQESLQKESRSLGSAGAVGGHAGDENDENMAAA